MSIEPGTVLTCSDDTCECRLTVEVACPHGDAYVCGCGHPLQPLDRDPIPPTPGA